MLHLIHCDTIKLLRPGAGFFSGKEKGARVEKKDLIGWVVSDFNNEFQILNFVYSY